MIIGSIGVKMFYIVVFVCILNKQFSYESMNVSYGHSFSMNVYSQKEMIVGMIVVWFNKAWLHIIRRIVFPYRSSKMDQSSEV